MVYSSTSGPAGGFENRENSDAQSNLGYLCPGDPYARAMDVHEALRMLLAGHRLTEPQATAVFTRLLSGELDPAQIGALLALLQTRSVSVEELVGAARVMRAHVTRVPVAKAIRSTLVDTCGTGGAPKTFNVSTAAAIITAAAGQGRLRVAKHGNRSRTGRGSAEVLQTLGVNVDASPEVQARCLDRAGVCFCFAIHHHPAMRHASGPRKALGFATIFNLLGPLTNPAGAPRQVLGVYERSLVEPMAGALLALGASSAMVVHGLDGLDELTTTGSSIIGEVSGGSVRLTEFDPVSIGLPRVRLEDLVAPDLAASAAMVLDIVRGARTPGRDLALLNAAAALVVGGLAKSLREGVELAASAVDRGEASRTLEMLIHESHATGLS